MGISKIGKTIYKSVTKKKNKLPEGISKRPKPIKMPNKTKATPTYGKPKTRNKSY